MDRAAIDHAKDIATFTLDLATCDVGMEQASVAPGRTYSECALSLEGRVDRRTQSHWGDIPAIIVDQRLACASFIWSVSVSRPWLAIRVPSVTNCCN